jgi:hypothetical protein
VTFCSRPRVRKLIECSESVHNDTVKLRAYIKFNSESVSVLRNSKVLKLYELNTDRGKFRGLFFEKKKSVTTNEPNSIRLSISVLQYFLISSLPRSRRARLRRDPL